MDDTLENVTGDDSAPDTAAQPENETPEAGATETAETPAVEFSHSDLVSEAAQIYEGFDPAVHAVNADGTPRLKSSGGYAMKRGRKPGDTGAKSAPVASTAKGTDPGAAKSPKAARQSGVITNAMAAKYIFATATTGLAQVFGPEWLPESQDEADGMRGVIKDYFDAHGQVQISPETMLTLSLIGYSVPRVSHENTRGKIARFFEWSKSALGAIFKR